MEKRLKSAICEAYAEVCTHRFPTYNGEHYVCELKERKEKCINRDRFDMLLNCPRECPHFPVFEKVICTPQKCAVARRFADNIEKKSNQEK